MSSKLSFTPGGSSNVIYLSKDGNILVIIVALPLLLLGHINLAPHVNLTFRDSPAPRQGTIRCMDMEGVAIGLDI
jgi:hypothetical protein